MLELGDPRWSQLLGGFRVPYDPRPALASLEAGAADAWAELWNELHHQGDVDTASYAAVPHLVRIHIARGEPDWNAYALVGTIEMERGANNPEVPPWLEPGYTTALQALAVHGASELWRSDSPELIRSALALIALSREQRPAARLLLVYSDDELEELVGE